MKTFNVFHNLLSVDIQILKIKQKGAYSMLSTIKQKLLSADKKTQAKVALISGGATMAAFTPIAFAASAPEQVLSKVLGLVCQIFLYIGILLLAWSVGMLVLAFKNEDADSKSRAMMMMVVAAALIGFKTFLTAILKAAGTSVTIGTL